jgi:RNA polymerase sigma-70 factor (ECF subfamily)
LRTFNYRPDVGRFRDWLGTVIRNEVFRFFKKKGSAAGGIEPADAIDSVEARAADTAWTAEFNAHLLQTALARSRPHFDEQTWWAFEQVWMQNHSALQIARDAGRAVDWVYVAKSRVLKRLWQEVRELADDSALLEFFTR